MYFMLTDKIFPKGIHVLIWEVCYYPILHGKRGFANVVKNLEMVSFFLSYLGAQNEHKDPYKWKSKVKEIAR